MSSEVKKMDRKIRTLELRRELVEAVEEREYWVAEAEVLRTAAKKEEALKHAAERTIRLAVRVLEQKMAELQDPEFCNQAVLPAFHIMLQHVRNTLCES